MESALGAALAGQAKFDEAEPLLVAGYEGLRDLPDAPAGHLRTALERMVTFDVAWGRPDQAVAWRTRLNGLPAPAPRNAGK